MSACANYIYMLTWNTAFRIDRRIVNGATDTVCKPVVCTKS